MPDLRGVSIRKETGSHKKAQSGRRPETALKISQGMETGSAKRLNQGMTSGAVVALAAAGTWCKLSINHKQILLLYLHLKNGGYIDFKRE